MRRAILAALLAMSSLGFFALPARADDLGLSSVVLSFDFSDNSAPASVTNGAFNVVADVLPAGTGGVVRMVAVAPLNSGVSNLVCPFQPVVQSQVGCAFSFTTSGVWSIRVQYATDTKSLVSSESVTSLRVSD